MRDRVLLERRHAWHAPGCGCRTDGSDTALAEEIGEGIGDDELLRIDGSDATCYQLQHYTLAGTLLQSQALNEPSV